MSITYPPTLPYKNGIGMAFFNRNIPLIRLVPKTQYIQVGLGHKQVRIDHSDISTHTSFALCTSKHYTDQLLEQTGFPTPKSGTASSVRDLERIYSNFPKPFVIKPVDQKHGIGISTNITSLASAKKAFEIAKSFSPDSIILQEHIFGDDHRLLFIGGSFVAAMKRCPPTVQGDGYSSIETLIKKENQRRSDLDRDLTPIPVSDAVLTHLEKSHLTTSDILPEGGVCQLLPVSNISSGGVGINITDSVHQSIIEMCENICAIFNLNVAGIDILTKDISKSLHETSGKVIEVNTRPGLSLHVDPMHGASIDAPQIFSKYLFDKVEDSWIPIEKNGKKISTQEALYTELSSIPKTVTQIDRLSNEKRILSSPAHTLRHYLLDARTTSVTL